MPQITIHQLEISPFCDKVRRVLTYKNLDFDVVNVPMAKLSGLKKLSKVGKVPIMEIDGEVIADSSNIIFELEKRFPSPSLTPQDPTARANAHVLEDWADESLYFFEMLMRFTWTHDRARWVPELLKYDHPILRALMSPMIPRITRKQGEAQGLAKRTEAQVLEELERHAQSIAALLSAGNDFLVGAELSLADIAVVAQLECIAGSSLGLKVLEAHPPIMDWVKRVEDLTGGPATR